MQDFKYTKFRKVNVSYIIREDFSKGGVPIIFKVDGHALSTMKSEEKFPDFDKESDEILETINIAPETKQVYFIWETGAFRRT
jgi:hypothetical protein